jgi:hypothetical protein
LADQVEALPVEEPHRLRPHLGLADEHFGEHQGCPSPLAVSRGGNGVLAPPPSR